MSSLAYYTDLHETLEIIDSTIIDRPLEEDEVYYCEFCSSEHRDWRQLKHTPDCVIYKIKKLLKKIF